MNKEIKNKPKYNNASQQNSYLASIERDSWLDINSIYIERASAWRNLAILAILVALIVSLTALYFINQDKHKVVVFERDSVGNLTALGLASKTMNVDNKMIAHSLVNFVIALREVPPGVNLKRRNIDIVHKMIDPNYIGSIDKLIINQYTIANELNVVVKITSIKPLANTNSWQINWQEDTLNPDGSSASAVAYSSSIHFKLLPVNDTDTQIINPIGLFVDYIDPVQDINDKDL